ncbi:MAG: RNA polymerase sigma factor [Acidobacteria bacterium]|nr:RNA polymerase sigma factor [Acidobacteriota bacterium]
MSEEEFEIFYDHTAKGLKGYLMRILNNSALADEILQESYFRILRADLPPMEERERKSYLFRVATNLTHDQYRGRREQCLPLQELTMAYPAQPEEDARRDLRRAMSELPQRERQAVWLAYVEGSSHREIATVLGMKEVSIRPMLFRARQRLVEMLKPVAALRKPVAALREPGGRLG